MAKESFCPLFVFIIALAFFCLFPSPPAFAQLKGASEPTPESLVARFKEVVNLPCGQRDEVFQIVREIYLGYGRDDSKWRALDWSMREFRTIEKEEARCKVDNSEKTFGELFREFKRALRQACGERDHALRLAKDIIERFKDDQSYRNDLDFVKEQFSAIEAEEKKCKEAVSLEALFNDYKVLRKQPCGERSKAIALGKRIINLFGDDTNKQSVLTYVEKDIAKITDRDRLCRRNMLYNQAYKNGNWSAFFAFSREIIEEEGASPLALDVMLTLASVGYRLSAVERREAYVSDTLFYAKKAIDLIEAGTRTSMRWGVFESFESMDKSLGWLNYVVGYVSYFRLREGKKAIPYFYKATQYKAEFKFDAFVYQAVAIHYFDKEAVTASSLTIHDFIRKAGSLGETNDPDISSQEAAKNRDIAMLYKQLVNLYNLRYNLAADENVTDLTDYIMKLISRPLIDTAVSKPRSTTFGQTN